MMAIKSMCGRLDFGASSDRLFAGEVYCARNATIGSAFVARNAGMQLANIATHVRTSEILTNVIGSVVLIPKSRLDITRSRRRGGRVTRD